MENGKGPVKLLGQEDANELVRGGERRERPGSLGPGSRLRGKTMGPAYRKNKAAGPGIEPALQLLGKGPGGPALAPLIE